MLRRGEEAREAQEAQEAQEAHADTYEDPHFEIGRKPDKPDKPKHTYADPHAEIESLRRQLTRALRINEVLSKALTNAVSEWSK